MRAALFAFVLAQSADVGSTALVLWRKGDTELNPILAGVGHHPDLVNILLVKSAAILLLILWADYRPNSWGVRRGIWTAAVLTACVAIANTLTLWSNL
jgi:hypothetical protein